MLGYGSVSAVDPSAITIEAQVAYLLELVERAAPDQPVHLVGHSVGGVIAASAAHRLPDRVASYVCVEGNLRLEDAFWSARLATMTPVEVADLLATDRADPARWLRRMSIKPTEERVHAAARALAFQPASTVHAAARAVVEFTGRPGYDQMLREVFDRVQVHLLAGARSRRHWHVPAWALAEAASYSEVAGRGHMMMLEAPEVFGRVLANLVNR